MEIFNEEIILASASPRRKEILQNAGFKIKVIPANVDENIKLEDLEKIAEKLAVKKAETIFEKEKNSLIIAADTTVIQDDLLLEKPQDKLEAEKFLNLMSNSNHKVITGVCVLSAQKKIAFSECTKVFVYQLNDEEIKYYINNFDVMDKAGAYGIQSWFGLNRVKKIEGCFYNVMGLPMPRLFEELKAFYEIK